MSDHEFEKQVQQKMDNLKLAPSDSVWERVKKDLHKQKRRRRIAIWVPLLFLGLGVTGYFVSKNAIVTTYTRVPQSTPSSKNNSNAVEANNSVKDQQSKEDEINRRETIPKKNQSENELGESSPNPKEKYQNKKQPFTDLITTTIQSKTKSKVQMERTMNPFEFSIVEKGKELSPAGREITIINRNTPDQSEKQISSIAGFNKQLLEKLAITESTGEKKTSNEKTTYNPNESRIKRVINKWKWGIAGNVGSSKIIDGGFFDLLENSAVADVAQQSSGSTPGARIFKPSAIRSRIGFSFGAFAQKQLSGKNQLSVSLNYSQFNTANRVGQQIDSFQAFNQGSFGYAYVSRYYRGPERKKYKNQYHFITLPVELHTQLKWIKKFPAYWDAGLSLSRLMSSNAIQFDGRNQVYYRDNDLFNKTQIGISTGFSMIAFSNKKIPVSIGPKLQYNMNSLMRKEIQGNKHLLFVAVDTKIFLRK